ncbi:HNH endonuclease [Candidatus Peregrinibacteria bacterium]|nr:HNH endonuclease [Candidatus Peregrinibacteria bacterium]
MQGANSSTKLQQQAQEVQNLPPSVPPAQNRIFVRLFLAPKNELKLKELQKKLSREQKAPVDLNEVVGILLDAYEKREDKVDEPAPAAKNSKSAKSVKTSVKIAESKTTEPAIKPKQNAVLPKPTPSQSQSAEKSAEPSRHIPTKIKKILYQKFAGRCAWPECIKLPKIFHHTLRFSLNPSHDSDNIVPLCKNHEQLAHHGLIENEEKSPENWRLKTETDRSAQKYQIDQKVIFHYAPQ